MKIGNFLFCQTRLHLCYEFFLCISTEKQIHASSEMENQVGKKNK